MKENNIIPNHILFKNLIETVLIPELINSGYKIICDNDNIDKNDLKCFIFKKILKLRNTISIYNDDWRDNVEYIHVDVNSNEVLLIKTDNYGDVKIPFELLQKTLRDYDNSL